MKIALFADLPFGGAHVATQQLVLYLKANHFLQEFRPSFTPPSSRFLSDLYAFTTARATQRALASQINSHFDVALVTHTRFFQAPWILRYLTLPTVFLCQEPTRAFFEDFLRPKNLPLPNLIYEHTLRFLKKKVEVANAQYPQVIVANSRFSARQIQHAYHRQATPILLGVDVHQFYPLHLPKRLQVIVIGNDEPQKALDFAVKTVALIKESYRPTLIIVSPRQKDHSRLHHLARTLGVKIKFYTNISLPRLRQLYNQSLATLAVAINEPFGLSVLESMACGTPVLAVDQGGFRETVVHQQTGYLLPRDPSIFAQHLTQLINRPPLLQHLGQQSRQHVINHFTWESTCQRIEKLIVSLVS